MGQIVYLEKLGQGQNQQREAPPSEQTVYSVVANMLEAALQILQNPQAVAKLRQLFRGGQFARNIQQNQPQQQQKAGSYNNLNYYDVVANFIKEAVSSIDNGLGNISIGGISPAPGISNRRQQTPYTGDFAVNTKNKGIRQKDTISFAKLNSPNFLPALKPPTESDLSPTKSRTEANANPMRNINPTNNQIANIIKTSLFKAAENPIERTQRSRAYTARELGDILSAQPKPGEDGYVIYGDLYNLRQRALEGISKMLSGGVPNHLPANQYENIIKRIADRKSDIRKFLSRTEEGRALITIAALTDIIRNNETTNPLYWMGVSLLAYYHDRIHKSLADQFGQEIANDIMSVLIYSKFFDKQQAGKEIDVPYLNIKLVLNPPQVGGNEPANPEPEKGYKRIGQFGNYSIIRKHDPQNPGVFDSPNKLLAKVLQDYENAWTYNPGFRDSIIRSPGFIGIRRLFGVLRDRYEEARTGGENLPDLGRNLTHIAPSRNYEQLQRNFVQQFMYPMALSNVEKVIHLKDDGSTYIVFNHNGKQYVMRADVKFYHAQTNPNAFGMPAVAMPGVMGPAPQQPQQQQQGQQQQGQARSVLLVDVMPAGPIVELNDNLRKKLFPEDAAAKRNILDITDEVKTSPNARAVAMVSQQLIYMRNMMSMVSAWAPFNPYMMMYYQMLNHQYNMARNMLESQYGQAIYVAPNMHNWHTISPADIDNRIRAEIAGGLARQAGDLGQAVARRIGHHLMAELGIGQNVRNLLKDVNDFEQFRNTLVNALAGDQGKQNFVQRLFDEAKNGNQYAQFIIASLALLLPGRSDDEPNPIAKAFAETGIYSRIGGQVLSQFGNDFIDMVREHRGFNDNSYRHMINHIETHMLAPFYQVNRNFLTRTINAYNQNQQQDQQQADQLWQQMKILNGQQLPGVWLEGIKDDIAREFQNRWGPVFQGLQIQYPQITLTPNTPRP
jgi:hypothetical protein